MNYFDRLAARSRNIDSLVCVGLDPDHGRHHVDEVAAYNREIIRATLPYAACYKPNLAFYEQWGSDGLRALERTLAEIPADVPVIGDAKRGDIGSTAQAYARALFETWGFAAVTVNAYLGRDATEPFLAYADRGVYVVCRTSNPGAADIQNLPLEGGGLMFEHLALTAATWGANVGLVAGATAAEELGRIRELVPRVPLLVPGVGVQGGDARAVIAAAGGEPGQTLVNASRSIYYAHASEGTDIGAAAADAARRLRDDLRAAVSMA